MTESDGLLISYKPDGESIRNFMLDESYFRGIRGPIGSGKSVACCVEIFRRAMQQAPSQDGVRRTRWAVIRNTNPQLKTTTIKTWLDWFPEDKFGKFTWSVPYVHNIRINDVHAEVYFLALDRPDDVRKLLSLELTGVWVNEAREVSKTIIDAASSRLFRFPARKDGGCTWSGIICDTNAPEDDHWWPIMAGESPMPEFISRDEALMLVKPDNWAFFKQPPAMLEHKDAMGNVLRYKLNPERENGKYTDDRYYTTTISGKAKSWIDVYILNKLGAVKDGKPVFPMFSQTTHISKDVLAAIPQSPVVIGLDFGLTPSAIFGQRIVGGQWHIFHEVVAQDMGIRRFSDVLRQEIAKVCPLSEITIYGDPAGDQRAQTDETTPFQILRAADMVAYPAPTNDITTRLETVESLLSKMIDGRPAILISPTCLNIIKGFESGYCYKRIQVSGDERYKDVPDKNRYSHPHDALQYLLCGAGESRHILSKKHSGQTHKATSKWNIWDMRNGFGKMRSTTPTVRRNGL